MGLAGWAAARMRKPAPPQPVEVALELDEPATPAVLIHGSAEEPIDLAGRVNLELTPGDYLLRLADAHALRRLLPERFLVEPGQSLTVPLRLVGEVRRNADHAESVWAVAVSPRQGEPWVLSASNDRTLGVWDARGRARARFFDRHEAPVRAVAFAPDGAAAASGGGGRGRRNDLSIRLWDVRTRRQTAQLVGHESWVVALAFAADGKSLASGGADGVVFLWDLKAKEKRLTLKANGGDGVNGVAFHPDGKRLLTAGGDGKVVLWDAVSGEKLQELTGHAGKGAASPSPRRERWPSRPVRTPSGCGT